MLYNCALEERISYYKKYNQSLSYCSQSKSLPEAKVNFPELKSVYAQVLQSTLKRVDRAYQGFFHRVKRGEKPGFPRFKGKNRFHSIMYPQNGFILGKRKGKRNNKWTTLKLSKIGNIRMRMHRNIKGNLKTCQIIRIPSGKWYVCLTCDGILKNPIAKTRKSIGIDLGVKNLITTSDGDSFKNPKFFYKYRKKLAIAQRGLSKLGYKNPRRSSVKLYIARLHERIINQRKDFYHKLSKRLVKNFDRIILEDLSINNMIKNNKHHLNREIQNVAWSQLVQMLLYKAESADKEVVLVDPRNTSKMCSSCGQLVLKDLSIRIHKCGCGLIMDRDHNAAINILNRGLPIVSPGRVGMDPLNHQKALVL